MGTYSLLLILPFSLWMNGENTWCPTVSKSRISALTSEEWHWTRRDTSGLPVAMRDCFVLTRIPGAYRQYKEEFVLPEEVRNHYGMSFIFIDRAGNVWVETWAGCSVWEAATGKIKNFSNYDEAGKLVYGPFGNFVQDQNGRIWYAAKRLLYFDSVQQAQPHYVDAGKFENKNIQYVNCREDQTLWGLGGRGMEHYDPVTGKTDFFSFEYGDRDFITAMLPTSKEGQLVLLDRGWLTFFDPDQLYRNEHLPRSYLTSFKVFDEPLVSDSILYHLKKVDLSYQENFFTFEFSAVDYHLPGAG